MPFHIIARGIKYAVFVGKRNIFCAEIPQKPGYRSAGSPRTVHDDFHVFYVFFHDFQGVYKPCKDDYRRAVLIVVEYGNIKFIVKSSFDFKATGTCNVFKVYAAETYRNVFYDIHDFVGILRVKTNRKRVDAAEFLKQYAFPFHNGHCRKTAKVSKPQNRAAVRHDRDKIPASRINV